MTDLTKWPRNYGRGRKPAQAVFIPPEWFELFRNALIQFKAAGYGENESHVIIRLVIEMAEKERIENERNRNQIA